VHDLLQIHALRCVLRLCGADILFQLLEHQLDMAMHMLAMLAMRGALQLGPASLAMQRSNAQTTPAAAAASCWALPSIREKVISRGELEQKSVKPAASQSRR
jgi:hypothetical protein